MAAMAGSSSSGAAAAMPSPNPIPLSASQEAQVRDIYYERVRQQCQEEIKAFAECALGRTFTVVFACRDKNRAMNACLKENAKPAALDAAREEWFARRAERAAERQRKARRKAEQEKLIRAWWGLEDQAGGGPGSAAAAGASPGAGAAGGSTDGTAHWEDAQARRRRLEEERSRRPERIGGFPAKDRPRFDEGTKP